MYDFSPSDPHITERLLPPRVLYSELEVERLRILFELIDVDAILEDPSITEWMEVKGIKRKNEQMRAIFGILKKRQEELEAVGSLREPVDSAKPSRELLESRMVRLGGIGEAK